MRYVFYAWAIPMSIFWSWYFVSLYDLGPGYMLSREANDLVFNIYGQVLGMDPAIIPGLVARACIIDTLLILAIWAFRRRREIWAWIKERRGLDDAKARRYAEAVSPPNL